jgi:magnesium-transporting ATPase (P-type)
LDLLAECVLWNCSAFVENINGKQVTKGNPTECGIINYFLDIKYEVDSKFAKKECDGFKAFDIPFDSNRKKQTTVVVHPETGLRRVYVKGAPEFVLQGCTSWL